MVQSVSGAPPPTAGERGEACQCRTYHVPELARGPVSCMSFFPNSNELILVPKPMDELVLRSVGQRPRKVGDELPDEVLAADEASNIGL